MKAEKFDLINKIEQILISNIKKFMDNNKDIINNPAFGPKSILNYMNTSMEEIRESLAGKREALGFSDEEVETIAKEVYSRAFATVELLAMKEEKVEDEEVDEEVKLPWPIKQRSLGMEEKKEIIQEMELQLSHQMQNAYEKGMPVEALNIIRLIYNYVEDLRFTLMEMQLSDEEIEDICNKIRAGAKLRHLGIVE